jgi:hypothetical protein
MLVRETRRDEDGDRERGRGGREGEREEMLETDEEKEGNFLSFWSMYCSRH